MTQHSQRSQEEKEEAITSVDPEMSTQPAKNVPPNKKVTVALRNWTCQAKEADAEQKFHAKVSMRPALE